MLKLECSKNEMKTREGARLVYIKLCSLVVGVNNKSLASFLAQIPWRSRGGGGVVDGPLGAPSLSLCRVVPLSLSPLLLNNSLPTGLNSTFSLSLLVSQSVAHSLTHSLTHPLTFLACRVRVSQPKAKELQDHVISLISDSGWLYSRNFLAIDRLKAHLEACLANYSP